MTCQSILSALLLAMAAALPVRAETPWRLADAIGAPDALIVKGETRARYESLDGQFRADGAGGDQALFFRTLLLAEWNRERWRAGIEFQDSRAYFDDEGTPLSSSFVNTVDVLQAYFGFEAPGLLGDGSSTDVIIGRQTVSIGSKRQVERVDFANVIKSFTGIHATSANRRDDELHLFFTFPVGRLPTERSRIGRNAFVANREQLGRKFWGVHYRRADSMAGILPDVWTEIFVYGLNERDTANVATPNRQNVWPGFRLYRPRNEGGVDFDIEGSWRFGSRLASSAPMETRRLRVSASRVFAAIGYTFAAPWRPRIAAEYYWASGDRDPNDDTFEQYERFFGSRRTDLNNTSIHGPLTPANLNAPGARLEITPNARSDARIAYSAASLASETDSWVIARLRDPTGASGEFVGHAIDARARYWIVPQSLQMELGASAFFFGEFARTAPGGPEGERTLFGYGQLTFSF